MSANLLIIVSVASLFFIHSGREAQAQSETPKFEVGAQFSVIRFENFDVSDELFRRELGFPPLQGSVMDPGFGGRFTYNVNNHLGLEAEMNFFPRGDLFDDGRQTQGLFGPKIGIRKEEKLGLFVKARPGFIHFNKFLKVEDLARGPEGVPTLSISIISSTFFALDLGGVVEFYPSRNALVRFDVGDTIVRYGSHSPREVNPAFTRHNLQFSAGFGFRF
ncbi:MAG TPA: outer membrane beta-barrel protein [Blastocatellia bacterium]|nr:outer membrane beta-barrel protein [Blastocatellia bacterium]